MLSTEKSWSKAFVPLAPAATKGTAAPVRLLLVTEEALTPADLETLARADTIPGQLLHGIESLKFRESVQLRMKYEKEGYHPDTCLLLLHGEVPQSARETYGKIVEAVLLVVSGAFIYPLTWLAFRQIRAWNAMQSPG